MPAKKTAKPTSRAPAKPTTKRISKVKARSKKKIEPKPSRTKEDKMEEIEAIVKKGVIIPYEKGSNKFNMIMALIKQLGIVSRACDAAGLSRAIHYQWIREDKQYQQAISDVEEMLIDFVEHKFFNRIKSNDSFCIVKFLSTKGKKRGYGEDVKPNVILPLADTPENRKKAAVLMDRYAAAMNNN